MIGYAMASAVGLPRGASPFLVASAVALAGAVIAVATRRGHDVEGAAVI